jgi:hypothetical protein
MGTDELIPPKRKKNIRGSVYFYNRGWKFV